MFFGVETVGEISADLLLQVVVIALIEFRRRDIALLLSNLLFQLIDRSADLLDLGVSEFDCVDDRFFLHFFGAGLDHHDAFGSADDHDVQQAVAHFAVGGIDDECAIHQSDANRADRTVERNVGDGECRGRAVDSGDVRIVLGVGREHKSNDLGFAVEAIGKQRPNRPVNHSAGENFALAGTSFALDEAAGNASAGVGVFAVVDGQGEEIDSFAGIRIRHCGGEDDVVSGSHYD